MRWVYIKNGNGVAQLRMTGPGSELPPKAGTEAYIGDLLHNIYGNPVLVLSALDTEETLVMDSVTARAYRIFGESDSKIIRCLRTLRALFLSAAGIIRFKPDRILCGKMGSFLWLSLVLSRLLRCQVVFSSHNDMLLSKNSFMQKLVMRLDNFCIRRVSAAICNGPFTADQLVSIGLDKELVHEFGVLWDEFEENIVSDESLPDSLPDKFLLYVGRLQANKGVFDLLDAFEATGVEGLSLVYLGGGADLERLRETVKSRGLDDRVFCPGRVPHEMLPAYMRASDAVMTPTQSCFPEGRCKVVMEAFIMGRPVIAPDFGPFPYLVKDGKNGMLYEADMVDDLGRCIKALYEEPGLLEKLSAGAAGSRDLVTPPATFYQAAENAFTAAAARNR